jgi:hypothetical protein
MNVAKTQELLFAVVGAGDFALEKAKNFSKVADRKTTTKVYKDFVKRGRSLSTRIKNSGATKKAIAQSKTARTQVKAAATSVTKAVRANTKATRTAATKATRAS